MIDSESSPGLSRAQQLGTPVLAALIDGSRAAVVVLRADRRVVYLNPAARALLGHPWESLRGRDFLDRVPTNEHPVLLRHLDPDTTDPAITFASIVRGAGETEHEIVGSSQTVRGQSGPLVVLTLWDQSGPHAAMRAGAALVQTAAMVGATSIDVMLTRIAQFVVEGTRASKCGLAVAGENDRLTNGGAFCTEHRPGALYHLASGSGWPGVSPRPAAEWISAISGGAVTVGGPAGKPVLMTDARSRWAADPVTRDYAASIEELPYRGCLAIPLSWQNRVIGVCTLHLPTEVAVLTERELAFATALTDQAALAVMNARLSAQAGETAALNERARLARELHDSVIQALFSMTMHARAAQLASEKAMAQPTDGTDAGRFGPLRRSLDQLTGLVGDALAEMRALILELRPDALSEDGLVVVLRQQAATLGSRTGFAVEVEGPEGRLPVKAETEEQLYRIAMEALHNASKHARAGRVVVQVRVTRDCVRLSVVDDGVGFDPRIAHPGHFGLTTMAERARSIGAELTVDSTPGAGTTVAVVAAPGAVLPG